MLQGRTYKNGVSSCCCTVEWTHSCYETSGTHNVYAVAILERIKGQIVKLICIVGIGLCFLIVVYVFYMHAVLLFFGCY